MTASFGKGLEGGFLHAWGCPSRGVAELIIKNLSIVKVEVGIYKLRERVSIAVE